MPPRSGGVAGSRSPPSPAAESAGRRSSGSSAGTSSVGRMSATVSRGAVSSVSRSATSRPGATDAGSTPSGGSTTSAWNPSTYGSRTARHPSSSAYAHVSVSRSDSTSTVSPPRSVKGEGAVSPTSNGASHRAANRTAFWSTRRR
ncbi:Uncharacterised protein [Mycobacteroides abscessus]|nr:Uncharacterised protein [Mycobacteroides abscessus]